MATAPLFSIKIVVSNKVFNELREKFSGIFEELDAQVKMLPCTNLEVSFNVLNTENNTEMFSDYLQVMSSYIRLVKRISDRGGAAPLDYSIEKNVSLRNPF